MSKCNHAGYREEMAYCPDCGEQHTGLVIAEQRIAELEQLEESNGELRREMDAQLAKLEAAALAVVATKTSLVPKFHRGVTNYMVGGDELRDLDAALLR